MPPPSRQLLCRALDGVLGRQQLPADRPHELGQSQGFGVPAAKGTGGGQAVPWPCRGMQEPPWGQEQDCCVQTGAAEEGEQPVPTWSHGQRAHLAVPTASPAGGAQPTWGPGHSQGNSGLWDPAPRRDGDLQQGKIKPRGSQRCAVDQKRLGDTVPRWHPPPPAPSTTGTCSGPPDLPLRPNPAVMHSGDRGRHPTERQAKGSSSPDTFASSLHSALQPAAEAEPRQG